MDEKAREFLERNHAAAMITLKRDGMPHVARMGVALIDGKLWGSGKRSRVRTTNIRRDPRSTLFVYDVSDPSNAWRWLALETAVTILEGPEAPELSLRLFHAMQPSPGPG